MDVFAVSCGRSTASGTYMDLQLLWPILQRAVVSFTSLDGSKPYGFHLPWIAKGNLLREHSTYGEAIETAERLF